jgi:hypothetical protein
MGKNLFTMETKLQIAGYGVKDDVSQIVKYSFV